MSTPNQKRKSRVSKTKARTPERLNKENKKVENFDNPEEIRELPDEPDENAVQIFPFMISMAAVYILICFLMNDARDDVGGIGVFIRNTFYGLFSNAAFLIPFMMGSTAFFLKKDLASGFCKYRLAFSLICLILYSALIHLFSSSAMPAAIVEEGFSVSGMFDDGKNYIGGGAVGGVVAEVLIKSIGTIGAGIFIISLSVIFSIFLLGYTPLNVARFFLSLVRDYKKSRSFERELIVKRKDPKNIFKMKTRRYRISSRALVDSARKNNINIKKKKVNTEKRAESEESPILTEPSIGIAVEPAWISEKLSLECESSESLESNEKCGVDIIDIIASDDGEKKSGKSDLVFETFKVFEEHGEDSIVKEYKLPPLSYLSRDTADAPNMDIGRELNITSSKLIETLESFGVKTKVSAVSRGPSVTRYEITPNSGVKVKSIINLVDDIALNLASGGVRIEAPIPGKAAVGIEVPNKTVSTVYLRTLLENPQFYQTPSKITAALGMDVAGNPIYFDIAKMPHLLISGATGMGKSVCINSLITSILYKAKPNEVKLILIDPKKVELNIYNGIPHLPVPVVSDPKKAAGSLNWAVAEMENRFVLIEERGVRDLKAYNDAVSADPFAEKLPQIIIVIDELADLMMTAPADVEQAICRLAQKARAAGMHLIIGTQRPSVDVITGLIKANIPSRIAFTVASQIDSRTIIDAKGAEELIGRGDMLYLPVGASKPIRVQGAYVSEKDVMNVTEFLKKQSDGEYDEQILNEIERETQKCSAAKTKLHGKQNKNKNEKLFINNKKG